MKRARRLGLTLPTLALLGLAGPGCSSRSLGDLSTTWAVDAAPITPAVPPGPAPDAGLPVREAGAPPPREEPSGSDPPVSETRDASVLDGESVVDVAPAVPPAVDARELPRVVLLAGRTSLGPNDTAISRRLASLGLDVAVHEDVETATLDLSGVALVFISATSSSPKIASTLRDLARPVIVSEPFLYDSFGLAPPDSNTMEGYGVVSQQTALAIVAPAHPLAAGLSGLVTIAAQPVRLNWGAPPKSAIAIASLGDQSGRLALFAYEAGSPMVGGLVAPARRVAFFADVRTASDLTSNGWALFDATVTWALGR